MKVLILYFSGTGNTKVIGQGYEQALSKIGHQVTLQSIEGLKTLEDHDLLIIGGPIYAGNMPHQLLFWLKKHLQSTKQSKKAIVFSTSAGLLNAHGVNSVGKKLIKNGYQVMDLIRYEMPRNFYVDRYEKTPEALQKKQFQIASQQLIASISKIDSNQTLQINDSVILKDMFADIFSIMAKFLGKNFKIHDNCIKCDVCQSNCPKNNISLEDKKYHNKCILCTRCIHNCPVNAISYKNKKIEPYQVHYELTLK